MSKIKRIIEIEESALERIKDILVIDKKYSLLPDTTNGIAYEAIAQSTPCNPSGDLISREALKEAIKDNGYSHYFEIFDIIDNAQAIPLPSEQIAWEQGYEAGLAQGKQDRTQGEYETECNVLISLEQIVRKSDGWEDSAVEAVHNAVQTAIKCMHDRPQGEWIYHEKLNMYFCKDCGLLEPLTKEEVEEGAKLPNFCEQCGADMKGD